MRLRNLFPLVAITSLSLTLGASTAQPSNEDYILGFAGDITGFCADESPTGMNIGATCHPVAGGTSYRVEIADALGHAVGYQWSFDDADGNCVGADPSDPLSDCPNAALACGTQVLGAPKGAVTLEILLDGFAFGPLDCTLDGPGDSPGFATVGTVTVTEVE